MKQTRPSLLAIVGTRPEALKLGPLIRLMRQPGSPLDVRLCFSGQHNEILESVLAELELPADIDLRAPSVARSLSQATAWLLERLEGAIGRERVDGVIVQGDTNTAFCGALAAFHFRLPVFHVEAGLRTYDLAQPFPEEANRRLIAQLAQRHFAPTERARENLLREGVADEDIVVTGNTSVDMLHAFRSRPCPEAEPLLSTLGSERFLLVTLHRRENEEVTRQIAATIRDVANDKGIDVLWILHLNRIRQHVLDVLSSARRVHLIEPQPYPVFVELLKRAHIVLSDSGGVQEEAPVLGTPALVLRDGTERQEAVEAGSSVVVGSDTGVIAETIERLMSDPAAHAAMARGRSPFGDGRASERILAALAGYFG